MSVVLGIEFNKLIEDVATIKKSLIVPNSTQRSKGLIFENYIYSETLFYCLNPTHPVADVRFNVFGDRTAGSTLQG